jgi:hypothetical protein
MFIGEGHEWGRVQSPRNGGKGGGRPDCTPKVEREEGTSWSVMEKACDVLIVTQSHRQQAVW